ncbi:hypothetical protein GOP47_0027424 [Adiantum capillus-veneris]|nr:hypothetical protein GOP47_0027424 [Adiantum capillus-veneris]
MAEFGIVPTLQNVVATTNLGCTLDLKEIILSARNAEYDPGRFSGVVMRIREPRTTASIFSTGKLVCVGAKSVEESKLAIRKFARIISKLQPNAMPRPQVKDFKVHNIVATCDVKFKVRLESLSYAHGNFSTYEPELFTGLIYRLIHPKVILLIFQSGKVVITGAKAVSDIEDAFENIYPILRTFQKIQDW